MFKEWPHPDEKQRADLSKRLGLEPRQVKFWFQNRRTQMKVSGRPNPQLSHSLWHARCFALLVQWCWA